MDDLKISVVINTYNQKHWIGKAIRSVLAQTYQPSEIIVVDDGSTDGTGEFVRREFAGRVTYELQPNTGIGSSRNRGIRLASGDWVAFLDGDDHWMPEKLQCQVRAIESNPGAAMAVCAWVESTPDDRILSHVGLPQPFTMKRIRAEMRRRGIFTPSGTMVRRDVLVAVGGFPEDLVFAEDWVTFARVSASHDVVGVDKPLFYKTQWPESLSSQPNAALRDGLISLRRCQEALSARRWPQSWLDRMAFRQSATQLFLHAAWLYGRRRDRMKALQNLLAGLIRWPFLTPHQYRSVYWLCAELLHTKETNAH